MHASLIIRFHSRQKNYSLQKQLKLVVLITPTHIPKVNAKKSGAGKLTAGYSMQAKSCRSRQPKSITLHKVAIWYEKLRFKSDINQFNLKPKAIEVTYNLINLSFKVCDSYSRGALGFLRYAKSLKFSCV